MPRRTFVAVSGARRSCLLFGDLGRRASLENGVGDEIAASRAHGMRDVSSHLVLRRLNGFATRPKPTTRLDDEQIAELDLVLGERDTTLFDESLRPREHATGSEELDGHIRQPLELLLSLDDVGSIMLDHALGDGAQLSDMLLEVALVCRETLVDGDVERRRGTERTPEARGREAADEAEISYWSA